jgi:hypothetical protein
VVLVLLGLCTPPGIGRAAPGALLNFVQPEQITKLYRNYNFDIGGNAPVRHRGKSPQQPAFFTRSIRARQETSLLASLCRSIGALPAGPVRIEPEPNRGELLCQAYESYRALLDSPLISFEHAVFLLGALWRGEELVIGACRDCGAVPVTDRWTMRTPRCIDCAPPARPAGLPL